MKLPQSLKRFLKRRANPRVAPPIPVVEQTLRFASVRESGNVRFHWQHAGDLAYWRSGIAVIASPHDTPVPPIGTTLLAWVPPATGGPIARYPVRIFYARLFTAWLDSVDEPDESDPYLVTPSSVKARQYAVTYPTSFGMVGRQGTIRCHWEAHVIQLRKQTTLYLSQHGISSDHLDGCPY